MRAGLPVLVDLLTLSSPVLLRVPAWHINHYAKLAAQLSKLRVEFRFQPMADRHRRLKEKVDALRDEWLPWKAWCLILGTIAGAVAAIVSLIDHG